MKSDIIFKAIKLIYPEIQGGYGFNQNQIEPVSGQFIDGLIWENKIFPKPKWEDIQKLIPQIELEDAKAQKINELNEFHSSPAVKQLTIKAGKLEAHIGLDSDSRYLLDEQIALLKFRIDLKEVNPTWTYQNGVSVPLNLSQLIGLRLFIGSLTDYNYKARREAEKTINNLKTVEDIINFDFKKNYKINQVIPLAL